MQNPVARFSTYLALSVVVCLPLAAIAQSTETSSDVLATVNNRPISQISVNNVALQISEAGEEADPDLILQELINLEILTQAAEELGLDKQAEISATLQLQYTQTMANAYLAQKGSQMQFTEEELRAEYDAQSANVDSAEYKASHILLETADDANRVLAELEKGIAFADAAADYSIEPVGDTGGDLGWFVASSMVPEFADAVAKLKVGETTATPVQTEFGFHIIKLDDIRNASLPDFESVKTGLTNLAVRRALAAHVEELKSAADIKLTR